MSSNNKNNKHWIDIIRTTNKYTNTFPYPHIVLDNTFSKYDKKINGLNTNLTKFQQTSLKAMIDIEQKRKINFRYKKNNLILHTSAGIYSDPVGSGKTIVILALILLQKSPKVVSDILPLEAFSFTNNTYKNETVTGFIKRRYKKFIQTTIVFSGASVIEQWADTIEQFTNMKYFKVTNVIHLRLLLSYIEDGSINNYDIVIVKNGIVTRTVTIPFGITTEYKNYNSSKKYIYNIISNIRNISWLRVIIDDFDTIHLPKNAGIINGLFTWYISSTKKRMNKQYLYNDSKFKKVEDIILHYDYGCSKIIDNFSLFNICNIRNNPDFIKKYNKLSRPRFYIVKYNNINDRYIGLLGEIGGNKTTEIIEMINSGSLNTAAEALKIQTTSVADMFEKILGGHSIKYKKSVRILKFINTIPDNLMEYIDILKIEPKKYKKSDLLDEMLPKYNYPNLKKLIRETKEEYTKIKKDTGATIQRIKDNIGEDNCPICSESLKDADNTIIMKCCSVITCDICGFSALNIKSSTTNVIGICPKCRTNITITSLISIGFNLDNINKFENSGFKEDVSDVSDVSDISDDSSDDDEDSSSDDEDSSDDEEDEQNRTKINGLLRIIRGKSIKGTIERQINISQIQKGSDEYIEPLSKNKKVLVFASYDESVKSIIDKLTEKKIIFWKLSGLAQNINKAAKMFNSCKETCALVINSTNYCSGLNLQTATDLVFMHKIIDSNTEIQVIGRGQRLGRESTLKVWYLLYNNEERYMRFR